ncbi:hypothetical protein BGZ63DRAFT_429403 [Mariannaea sp. PMI_226]|nr:hypothetical protein BGZ63DRAFT_429403 [Mariannaea sp. PMI_226]
MKFSILAMTVFAGFSLATPMVIDKRSSCQLGDIWIFHAADAACSASCLAQHLNFHGGHCNADKVCVCN